MEIKIQKDLKDCGISVVQSFHKFYYGEWIHESTLKKKAKIGTRGMSIANVEELIKNFGMKSETYEIEFDEIKKLPRKWYATAIKSHDGGHFINFKITNKKVIVADPAKGKYMLSHKSFKKLFLGNLINIEKTRHKPKIMKLNSPYSILWKNSFLLTSVIVSLLIELIFLFASTLFMKLIMDVILPNWMDKTLLLIFLSFSWMAVLRTINNNIRNYLNTKLSLKIKHMLFKNIFWKLENGNLIEINKLSRDDYYRRIGVVQDVTNFFSSFIFSLISNVILIIVSGSILIFISMQLFSLVILSTSIIFFTSYLVQYFLKGKIKEISKDGLEYISSMMDNICSLEEIRNTTYNEYLSSRNQNSFQKLEKNKHRIWSVTMLQNLILGVVASLTPLTITYLGVLNIFENKLTIGTLLMFMSLYSYFIDPVKQLSQFAITYKQNKVNTDLLVYILNIDDEEINENGFELENINNIDFKNLKFGYTKTIFDIKDFNINENLHICGKNGSGKSTLLNILSTKIILKDSYYINGVDINYYDISKVRNMIIHIKPNQYYPKISVIDFITNGDHRLRKTFIENIQKLNLQKLFIESDINLKTILVNDGSGLSSGQKQLISIFRLFVKKYKLILLDEAFENIDSNKHEILRKAILHFQNEAKFVEISHSKKYCSVGKEVEINVLSKNK